MEPVRGCRAERITDGSQEERNADEPAGDGVGGAGGARELGRERCHTAEGQTGRSGRETGERRTPEGKAHRGEAGRHDDRRRDIRENAEKQRGGEGG